MITDARNPNWIMLRQAAAKLQPLLENITFVGGCVTGMLITDTGTAPVRPTLDVDAIVEVVSYVEFTKLENQLRALGFHESTAEGAPIYRWIHGDLLLDLMPTDPAILGFSNRWYPACARTAILIQIEAYKIRLITAPYFLATKVEAFRSRGKNDYRASHDLEDVVTVIDGRVEVVEEVRKSDSEVKHFLQNEFSALLADRNFVEALPGHLLPDAASQQRLRIIIERLEQITS